MYKSGTGIVDFQKTLVGFLSLFRLPTLGSSQSVTKMKKIYNNNNNNKKLNIKRNYCSDVNLTRNFEILKIDAKKNYILQDWYSRLQIPRTSFVQLKTVATSSIQLSTHYTTTAH